MSTQPKPAPLPPKDRRKPLSLVVFRTPTEIDGIDLHVKRLIPGEPINVSGMKCPQLFLDPELRTIVIGDSHYPLEGVVRWVFAKIAKVVK